MPEAKMVELKPMNLRSIEVEIVGLAPGLLMHRFSEKAKRQIEENQQGTKSKTKAPRDPDSEIEAALHSLSPARDGAEFGFPAVGFKSAMVSAGGRVTGHVMTELRALFFVEGGIDGLVPIRGVEWVRDERFVRIGRGTTDIRYRPLFPAGWRATLAIEYNADGITPDALVNLVNVAGFSIGVGDYRPEKDGDCGRFRVVGSDE